MDYDDLFGTTNVSVSIHTPAPASYAIAEDYSETDIDNVITESKQQILTTNRMGYVIRRIRKDDGKYKRETILYYKTSYVPGTYIRNALTGDYYNFLVGSKFENLLYKVFLSTGEKGTQTTVLHNHYKDKTINEPSILYYDSPIEYEKHFCCRVGPAIKEKWNIKQAGLATI